jgi:mannose-6-phosphate isomerase-like protein (cupin superfamily)
MTEPTLHRPQEGERHRIGNSELLIKATGADTGGSFFLSESTIEPGFPGPPLHRHAQLHDMFYVLEGTLQMRLGDETLSAGPGTFVCVPPGVPHTFSNPSEQAVRILNFNTPSGWESYMRDLAAAAQSGPLTPERIGAIASRYDFEPV